MNWTRVPLLSLAAIAAMSAPSAPLFGQATAASRPSFSCARAKPGAERLICADVELSRLDRIVSDLFAETRSLLLNSQQTAEADAAQRAWLTRRNRCREVQCLRRAYFSRVTELARELPGDE